MKKYTFLVYHQEYDAFLQAMRELGVLHIIEKSAGLPQEDSSLQQMLSDEARYKKVIRQLESRVQRKVSLSQADPKADGIDLLNRYESIVEQKAKEVQRQANLQKEIDRLQIWGHFNWENIENLSQAGYAIRFYSAPTKAFEADWIDKYNAIVICRDAMTVYFITVMPNGETSEIEHADLVKLPAISLSELEKELDESLQQTQHLEKELDRFTQLELNTLKLAQKRQTETFEYSKVILNTGKEADEKLMLLQGWVPVTKEDKVNSFLEAQHIYFQVEKPTEEDNVPVLLKNNAFTRLFEAIGELYDMPNYHEMDLTPFFAPFFVMFFGLCLGDAGYGLLITLIAIIARSKVKPSLKPFMTLAICLGVGTVIFGTISGTLFGIPLLEVKWNWIQDIKGFMMNSDQLFNFALIVGGFQIIFGMTLKAIGSTRRFGFLRSLSHWGWLVLVLGCGVTFGLHHFEKITSESARIAYISVVAFSAIGIFLFNDIKRNPLVNIGAGVWDSYNMATGLLGDLLSYIRLFALGISGSVMGLVFNDLALKLTESLPVVVSQLVMIFILIFGHGMNIFMSGLGAFVHPMRLTFVEFYKNAGFEGGGKKYKPFKKEIEE